MFRVFYSKYSFNNNLIDENVTINKRLKEIDNKNKKKSILILEQEKKSFKFLPEIILDIIFYLLNKREDSELLTLLYNNLKLKEKNSIFYEIDDYFLSESNTDKNQTNYNNKIIQLINSCKISTVYCKATNRNSMLFSTYFFIYFFDKQNNYSRDLYKITDNNESGLSTLCDMAIEIFFKDTIAIFNKHIKKIKKNKKIIISEMVYKTYYVIFEHFLSKYKDCNFNFNSSKKISTYFNQFLKSSKTQHKIKKMQHKISLHSEYSNPLDKSYLLPYGVRKTSFLPEESLLIKVNGRETRNSYFLTDNILFFKKSNSEDFGKNINKYNNIFSSQKPKESEDNSLTEFSIHKIKTPKIQTRDSKKNFYEIESITSTSNFDQSSETSENSFYENNNLFFYSNYNCSNYTEEKQRKRKNAFYLNNKNFKSCIFLNHHLLSSNRLVYDIDDTSEYSKGEKSQKSKLSQDDTYNANNLTLPDINNNTTEKDNNSSDINNEMIDDHEYILNKLKENDIPYFYYKDITSREEPKWSRIVLSPKREIMRIFGFVFRKYIYKNKNFRKLKNCFNIKFRNKELESSIKDDLNYTLNYPTKLRNFTCTDYYRPFLKPILNYFDTEHFYNSHSYLKKEEIQKDIHEEDQLGKIDYENIYLYIKKKTIDYRIKCEKISNKGSIYGILHLNNSLMVFQDNSAKDHRLSKETQSSKLFYLFSSDVIDRLENQNKYIIIYYNEIKEIILRRYCFTEIGYEIFTKDNRSYFFNFFNVENRTKFYNSLKKRINAINTKIKENEKNNTSNNNNLVDILFINEPKSFFEKKNFSYGYTKNEITNFQYLLLVNKFSTRTYNDNSQYLIFPLLYMDINKKKERDLSKAICLNKKLTENDYSKYQNNFVSMGYHFNSHYSTMAYVTYYLMRILPFTNCQIKLQSGHFDAPTRMFTSLENLLYVFQISDENRELCPEFFFSYESFLNLNFNDFGYLKVDKKQIHHFNTSQKCGIVEFIIDLRNILEKKELDQWINNIFGYKQVNFSLKSYNSYPAYAYEQFNNFAKEKEELSEKKNSIDSKKFNEKIKEIRNKIELLSMGLTPIQLFKYPHPTKEIDSKKPNNDTLINEQINNISNLAHVKRKSKTFETNRFLKEFINKTNLQNLLYCFNSFNINGDLKILFLYETQLKIFNFISINDSEKNKSEITIDFEKDINILNIKPYRNLFLELYDNVFLLCRLSNKTLLLCSEKQKVFIEWPCLITAIELYTHVKSVTHSNVECHTNKIIVGDEDGYLSIIEISTEYYDKKKEFVITSLNNNFKKNKAHYSYINGLIFSANLNVIISSCGKGYITINNAYSFDIINVIKIGHNINILDFQLSRYDLLYIYTSQQSANNKGNLYELYCYTLNGIKISKIDTKKELINYYLNNKSLYTITKDGNICEYNCTNFKEVEKQLKKEELKANKNNGNILQCVYYSKIPQLFIIFINKYENIQIYNHS